MNPSSNDGDLLKEFTATGVERPFAELVRRHSGMVLGVCRRMTGDEQDAEDAAQAVFLTLVKKARGLCNRASLGGWLYHVACHVSLCVRESKAIRQTREKEAAMSATTHVEPKDYKEEELKRWLDRELDALPEKYRVPVVLHHLEERPHEEVARLLGLTANAVAVRLNRAREMLAGRLTRRGVALSAAGLGTVLSAQMASAAPDTFVEATTKAATLLASGKGAVVSVKVTALVKATLKSMLMKQIAVAAAIVLAVGGGTVGAMVGVAKIRQQSANTLEGIVFDPQGKPVQGAVIQPEEKNMTKTDARGRFYLKGEKPGEVVLKVQAKEYAWDVRQITWDPKAPPMEIHLQPAHTVRGRVVDEQGKPITGGWIAVEHWWWQLDNTDAEGRFIWKNAPANALGYDFGQASGKDGYQPVRNHVITYSDPEHVIVLYKPLIIRGQVSDAETGQSIPAFKVILGSPGNTDIPPNPDPDHASWARTGAKDFQQGGYEVVEAERVSNSPYILIRIEAEGYEPASSKPLLRTGGGGVTLDFKLNKGKWITGTVRSPDGKPVPEATVDVATKGSNVIVKDGAFYEQQQTSILHVKTDAEGSFRFQDPSQPFKLVVAHPKGYAEVPAEQLATSLDILLEAWGRIEGTFKIGREPKADRSMRFSSGKGMGLPARDDISISYSYSWVKTDANGRFTFEKVPPTDILISPEGGNIQCVLVEVKTGASTRVDIGGSGRSVVGHLAIPKELAEEIASGERVGEMRLREKPASYPNELSEKQRNAWYWKWRLETPEGKAYRFRDASNHYSFPLQPDASFRIENVSPGTYQMEIELKAGLKPMGFGDPVGLVEKEIMVPAGGEEAVDLGAIEPTLFKRVKPGEAAPLFETKTIDGQPLKLADFRGKYVLLDFWQPRRYSDTPYPNVVYDAYGKDERFVMITLNVGTPLDRIKQGVEANHLGWIQGYFEEEPKTLMEDYGVRDYPAIFLIGPDGKVIARALEGEGIKEAVAKALKKAE